MSLPPEIIPTVSNIVRRLSSCDDKDIVASVCGLQRVLKSADTDVHALADHIEKANGGLSDADKQKIRSEIENAHAIGYAEGVAAAEARQHGTGAFRNTDGTLEWAEVARYVQREKHRLDVKHHEFVDDMAARTVYGHEPTPKQHRYLHSLFFKLGGKIT
jgi:hypothetical protein